MTDSEVGKLWAHLQGVCGDYHHGEMLDLICKLVEERAARVRAETQDTPDIGLILADFGIDPATWSEK